MRTRTTTFDKEEKSMLGVAKHSILQHYVDAWLATLCRNSYRISGNYSVEQPQYQRVVYVDGFSGGGSHPPSSSGITNKDDLLGSPTLVYERALQHSNLPKTNCPEIVLIFIEKEKGYCDRLYEHLCRIKNSPRETTHDVKFIVVNGEFKNAMEWVLGSSFQLPSNSEEYVTSVPENSFYNETSSPDTSYNQYNGFIGPHTPLFVFVDPFGYNGAHMPMKLMRRILRASTKSEIFVNLMTSYIRRFFGLDNRTKPINLLLGLEETDVTWKEKILQAKPEDRVDLLLQIYYNRITEECSEDTYSLKFEMRSNKNVLVYHLFFISQHKAAYRKMLAAMKSVTHDEYVFKFSAYIDKNPNIDVKTISLEEKRLMIINRFATSGNVSGNEIVEFLEFSKTIGRIERNNLKSALKNYIVPGCETVNVFDDMMFNFSRPNTVGIDEHFAQDNSQTSTSKKRKCAKQGSSKSPSSSKLKKKIHDKSPQKNTLDKYLSPEKKK